MKAKRFIVVLFFLVLFVGEVSQVEASSVGQNKYVTSKGDLILRVEPNSKGAKVTMLKKGSKVFVYSTDKNGWSHIKQGNYRGYTKDSYLVAKSSSTAKKIPKSTLAEKELKNALIEIRAKQKKYPTYSQEYRDALNEENKIIQKLIDLNNQKIKELEKSIGR
ncbi:SH3 domain-containing protein [Sporosarcina newyorkensis]|uniref:SH3 domain-containing protein n=1 Tax=Sporosarcina newyorkensis TaxID=759851 RepID=A0A1T4YSY8_9BACL|nr:SH3 domain-containing protein [Sporosarcina newyorkensis]SKB04987.1 SH3 domain-containing protein [Sporosarcina newyorkensis]